MGDSSNAMRRVRADSSNLPEVCRDLARAMSTAWVAAGVARVRARVSDTAASPSARGSSCMSFAVLFDTASTMASTVGYRSGCTTSRSNVKSLSAIARSSSSMLSEP